MLLLALSEQMPFDAAYGISALTIVALITAYAAASFRQRRLTGATAGVLAVVYGFLFVVLQLQDYALLVGSIGLVVVLGAVMFLSRNVDWYNPAGASAQDPATP